jgi:hypothetical protein
MNSKPEKQAVYINLGWRCVSMASVNGRDYRPVVTDINAGLPLIWSRVQSAWNHDRAGNLFLIIMRIGLVFPANLFAMEE